MIYRVRHVTSYDYAASVPLARCLLRVVPSDRPGQRVISSRVAVDPVPDQRADAVDFFGNRVVRVALDVPHTSFTISTLAKVVVEPRLGESAGALPWERVRAMAALSRAFGARAPAHALFPSRNVALLDDVTAYALASFPRGAPIVEAALDLSRRIKADFAYDPEATDVSTPLAEAFAARHGVCQDFAHVMIAGLRGLGLPAAYVSGYLRTVPPPGKPRLEGADATHAWVEVWCGPDLGWIGFDPTNGVIAGDSHIVVAVGRDYADVPPVEGVIVTSGDHTLEVEVDVVAVEA